MNRAAMEATLRQSQVEDAIWAIWMRHSRPPSIRELCAATGIKHVNGIVGHLAALSEKGIIEWSRNQRARSIWPAGLRREIKQLIRQLRSNSPKQ